METLTWIAPDGSSTILDGDSFFVTKGLDGRGLPPMDNIVDEVASIDGARLRQVNVRPREIVVPLHLQAPTRDALRASILSLLPKFYTRTADGQLVVSYPDSTTRRIYCRYASGMSLEESSDRAAREYQQFLLTLLANDPFWYGDIVAASWSLGASTTFLGNPIFPMRLSPSSIQGSQIVHNAGDVSAFPIWTITGPGSGLNIVNQDTGEKISLTRVLAAGEVVTIDTRPGYRTATSSSGGNIYGSLSTDTSLWWLPAGDAPVSFGMDDATAGASISISFSPRYLSA